MSNLRIPLLLMAAALLAADNGYSLFQRGLAKERADADPRGAIRIYEQVLQDKSIDRKLAAQALLRMAECHQKLGDAEARKIYERLVRDYADQKEAVDAARARLHGALAKSHGVVMRQVWQDGDVHILGSVSPDGRYLAFAHSNGNIFLRDLTTGNNRQLTNDCVPNACAYESVISRDSKRVAYAWNKSGQSRAELRIADIAGDPKPRTLFDNEDVSWIAPLDWSPDGKWLSVGLTRADGAAQIGLVSATSGALTVLKSVDWQGVGGGLFSADGKYVAVDVPVGDAGQQRDIFLLAVDGSREIHAVIHPSQDRVIGWTPDGARLLFRSDRSGSMSVWALTFAGGKPDGFPELIKADIGQYHSMTLTRTGSLYYAGTTRDVDIQTADFDFVAGQILTPPARLVQESVGSNQSPDWSRDGKLLSYVTRRSGAGRVLAIRNVETGQVRKLRPTLASFYLPRWAPDSRSFVAQGYDSKSREGIFRIDAETGRASPIVLAEAGQEISTPAWSNDGTRIYFRRANNTTGVSAFVERDLRSGAEHEILRRAVLGFVNLSPDGKFIATASGDPSGTTSTVLLIPVAGGEARELIRVDAPEKVGVVMWAPDSRSVFISKAKAREAWRVPLETGQPHKVGLDLAALKVANQIRVHPDGRQIAYVTAFRKPVTEVWVMENFLPVLRAKR